MITILGCYLNFKSIKTDFSVYDINESIVILPDPGTHDTVSSEYFWRKTDSSE